MAVAIVSLLLGAACYVVALRLCRQALGPREKLSFLHHLRRDCSRS